MDRKAAFEVQRNPLLKALFQAAILVASENGQTVRTLAESLGVGKSTIHRWVVSAKKTRDERVRKLRAHLLSAPCAASGCLHTATIESSTLGPGLVICLDCGATSPALERLLVRDRRPNPSLERSHYKSKLMGGK